MIFAEACAARKQQSRVAKRVLCFGEEFELPLQTELRLVAVVDHLGALDDFVVILLDKMLRSEVANVVEARVADPAKILDQVLAQAVHQPVHVLALSELTHVGQPGLDPFVVVQLGDFFVSEVLVPAKKVQCVSYLLKFSHATDIVQGLAEFTDGVQSQNMRCELEVETINQFDDRLTQLIRGNERRLQKMK